MSSTLVGVGASWKCSVAECKNPPAFSIEGRITDKRSLKSLACAAHLQDGTRFVIFLCGKADVEEYAAPTPPRPSKETIADVRKTHEIVACGKTPQEALKSLGENLEWGELADFKDLGGGADEFEWGLRFTADGTGMKAAGWSVPGGVVVAWWK